MLKDKRLRLAFALALLEWLVVGGLILLGQQENFPFLVLFIALVSAAQVWTLFGHWRGRGPFHQAQQAFMRGDYAAAIAQLESQEAPNAQSQTLLANSYRQLGKLDHSEALLRALVAEHPRDAFPRYGLGRTLLAQGNFAEAAQQIQQALADGGKKVTAAELALAQAFAGEVAAAVAAAKRATRLLQMEPHRHLMVNYLLHSLAGDEKALPYMQRFAQGLAYWEAEAARFSNTDYGARLSAELLQMRTLLHADAGP